MASMLVLVSKAIFEKDAPRGLAPGGLWPVGVWNSKAPALGEVAKGGSLFLVTVRPPEQLWLVGVLEAPRFDGERWHAAPNVVRAVDVSPLISSLVFSTGKGIKPDPGKLGMSLQTPRVLTEGDEAILRRAGGAGPPATAPAASALRVTAAVRLVREHIARLGEIHKRQFVAMMAPGSTLDRASEIIDTGSDEDDDRGEGGLAYVRFEDTRDASRAFDAWFYDLALHPETKLQPDGAMVFVSGTCDSAGIEMSQSTWNRPTDSGVAALLESVKAAVGGVRLAVKGAALVANPPFALAKAPPPPPVNREEGALDLDVVTARRLTRAEARAMPPEQRLQLLHSVRPRFATPTTEGMERPSALGMVYDGIDPGPDRDTRGHASGLVYLLLRTREATPREFDGWFLDYRCEEAEAYWPSPRAMITWGRLFLAGTIKWSGVEVKDKRSLGPDGKVRVKARVVADAVKGLPVAPALAKGLEKLGLCFDVEVTRAPKPGEAWYFGSEEHARQLREARGFHEGEKKYREEKKAKKG
jgi:hypothetical protein